MSFNLLHSPPLTSLTSHVTPYMSPVCLSTYHCVPLCAHCMSLCTPYVHQWSCCWCPPMCCLCANIFTPTYPLHAPTFPTVPPFVPLHVPICFTNVPYISACVFYVPSYISPAGPLTCPSVCPSVQVFLLYYSESITIAFIYKETLASTLRRNTKKIHSRKKSVHHLTKRPQHRLDSICHNKMLSRFFNVSIFYLTFYFT